MALFKKGKKLYSVFNYKCPKCHEGDLYKTSTFSFQKPFEMHDRCPKCNENYMPEPGFYYGAMFVSYIMMAFFCLAFVSVGVWGIGWSINQAFIALIIFCAIFFVHIFRLSRAIWINIVVKYDNKVLKIKN